MAFTLTEQHFEEFYHHGATIFRNLLPVSLLKDLRRAAAPGREMARAKANNPNAQRLQPVCATELDQKPFEDFQQLPELNDALHALLSPEHVQVGNEWLGIFYEPGEKPQCTSWHRDLTPDSPRVPDRDEFLQLRADQGNFTQVNCALYTDVSTWYVPGSGRRPDTRSEASLSKHDYLPPENDLDHVTLERKQLEYCRAMPNAVQAVLEPGDYMFYDPLGWHIGNYSPDRIRTTLHTGVMNPTMFDWYARFLGRPVTPGSAKTASAS